MGMITLSMFVITQQYFDKRRALAAGLAVSGFSLGTLTSGPLIHLLLDLYTWRGTLLILGGIFLHILPLALTFRPLVPKTKKRALTNGEAKKTVRLGVLVLLLVCS